MVRHSDSLPDIECWPKTITALLQVVRVRASKGDEAHDKQNFILARKQWATAYERIQNIAKTHHPFRLSVPNDLILDILSKITTASLELHDYGSVQKYAEEIIAVEPSFFTILTVVPLRRRIPGVYPAPGYVPEIVRIQYAKEAFYTASYCKAVAYQKQGNIRAAIQEFRNALLCDSGCVATFYQLEELRRRCPEANGEAEVLVSKKWESVAW